jgi:Divergent InlB B-repeat domain/PASTA domain
VKIRKPLPFARAASRRSTFVLCVFAILLAVGAAVGLARGSSGSSTAPAFAGPRLAAGTALGSPSPSSEATSVTRSHGVIVGHAVAHVRTRALRSIPLVPFRLRSEHEASRNPRLGSKTRAAVDPVVQRELARPRMPSPTLNLPGISFPGVSCNCAPPDTNGEVGATQYVQMVNQGLEVFNKATGASVLGPVDIATIWSGAGNVCATGFGDPVVLYDQLAGRWVITQFAGTSIPTDECIAVSTSSDATGSYNAYDFHLGTDFFDYPHFGVWPDAYYMSMNVFNSSGSAFLGPQPFAFDRAAMLAGSPSPSFVTFRNAPFFTSTADPFMPADVDGQNPPPSGVPNPFLTEGIGATWPLYRFHVDFANPANSTFTLAANLTPAPYTPLCSISTCSTVPQSGTSDRLDTLGDRGMFRNAYRNFGGGREALVGNISVSSGGVAGIRWFELNSVTSGTPSLVQQSTYQPDTTYRWMGSAAMDGVGDLALGFSASSSLINPEIRYAGRLAGDPSGQLAQGEATLFPGTGSQTHTNGRWGDYSDMTVDPTDDCTFWYTQEYYATTGQFNWRTRIGDFKFPSCGVARLTATKAGAGSGSITSSPSGFDCGTNCAFTFADGTTVTLTAAADANSVFAGWSGGGCSGTGACTVTLSADTTVTASFVPLRTLTVARSGNGSGAVTSSPAGISCGASCSAQFVDATSVTLTASPDSGSLFTGWSGDCTGTEPCVLSMAGNHSVTAGFAKVVKCKVPKVVGLKLPKAKSKLVKAHCRTGKVTKKFSNSKKKGKVIGQKPKAGKTLPAGSKVKLTVGKGQRRH